MRGDPNEIASVGGEAAGRAWVDWRNETMTTRDEIERIADAVGSAELSKDDVREVLEALCEQARAVERERCAAVCDEYASEYEDKFEEAMRHLLSTARFAARRNAANDLSWRIRALGPAPSQSGDVRAWGERVAHEAYRLGEDHASSYEHGGGARRLDAKAMERIFDEAGPAPQPAPSEAVAMAIAEDVVLAGLEQMHSPPSKEDLRAIVRRHLAASGEATAERERALVRAGAKLGARRYNGVPPAVGDAECDAIREAVRS